MRFEYRASNARGEAVSGLLDAEGSQEAARLLSRQGLTPIQIQERTEEQAGSVRTRTRRLSQDEILTTFYELQTMLESGLSLHEAVDSLSQAARHPKLMAAIDALLDSLQGGERFSAALRETGLPLPEFFLQLVAAGERTGELAASLKSGLEQMEYQARLAKDVRNALIYPLILIVSGVGAVAIIFVFVVPKFADLLDRGNQDLPLLAEMVLYGGLWANTYAPYLALGAAGMAVLAVRLVRMKWVREKLWRLAFRLPVVGQWLTNVEIARWSSVMAGLLQNRVELTEALALAGKTVRAPQWEGRFQQVRDSVEGGDRLSRALYHSGVLSPTSYNLIFSGEKSGNLPEMFGAVSRLADDSAQTRMKRVLTLIEPLAILLIGSVVGVIILGVVLAITSANQVGI